MMSVKAPTLKDGLLILPYVLKAAALIAVAHWGLDEILAVGVGAVILALANLAVIAALAFGGGRALESARWAACKMEMAASAVLFLLGGFHAVRGERGDEVCLVYFILALPLLLLAQVNLIPFDAEKEGPL